MPIRLPAPLAVLSQDEFGALAYDVKGVVIEIHRQFGRFFDEKVYKLELARRMTGVRLESVVEVTHRTFLKRYFLDVLIGEGGLFEFKAAEALSPRHRAQLLHYLMLCGLLHGMLISTRGDKVVSEFVNTGYTLEKRRCFRIDTSRWMPGSPGAAELESITRDLLADWGTGLDVSLYEEALTHFLGGEATVLRPVPVISQGSHLTDQKVRLVTDSTAFKLTAFKRIPETFEKHARQFLQNTILSTIQWINITPQFITFTTLDRRNPDS
jgi:GxxExxY protein